MQKEVTGAFPARIIEPVEQSITVIRLSAKSAYFAAPEAWKPGSRIEMELRLGTDKNPVSIGGEIQKVESDEGGDFIAHVLFTGIDGEVQRRIVAFVDELVVDEYLQPFPAGTVVFKEGDVSRHIYYIALGKLSVEKDGKPIAEITESDQFVGEISFLLEEPRTATVKAAEDSMLMAIPADVFQKNLSENPKFGVALSKLLAKRLRETTLLLAHEKTKDRAMT